VVIKSHLLRQFQRVVGHIVESAANSSRDERNTDIVLSAALSASDISQHVRVPVAYTQFLREALGPCRSRLTEIRLRDNSADRAYNRFDMLCYLLRNNLPPLDYSLARGIAMIADGYRSLPQPFEYAQWAGDIGLHFSRSSSFGWKGRILFNTVRIMRPQRCLELGTAYGMSSLFILAALKAFVDCGSLATVEGAEAIYSLSSSMLKRQYGEMVSCTLGDIRLMLPELVKSLGKIDFFFHDSSHSREDYINDFSAVVESLAPGAVVIIDDIRWEDSRLSASSRTYEGWQAVSVHPRVRRAIEVDGTLGLLLIR
jgi:predicted O-methyltransferase YrrM